MKINMRHFDGVLREQDGTNGCPHCGAPMQQCSYIEIQVVTYEYDPKKGLHVPVEYASPEDLDYLVNYDDDHPACLGKCNQCNHEWAAFTQE
jgi:hypothetical protein